MTEPPHRRRRSSGESYSRSEDFSPWARINHLAARYAIIWGPLLWFLTALGFGYVTPRQKAEEVKAEIEHQNVALTAKLDTTRAALQTQIDALREDQRQLRDTHVSLDHGVEVLVRLGCMDPMISSREKRAAGLVTPDGNCIR